MISRIILFSPPPHHHWIQATITPHQDACLWPLRPFSHSSQNGLLWMKIRPPTTLLKSCQWLPVALWTQSYFLAVANKTLLGLASAISPSLLSPTPPSSTLLGPHWFLFVLCTQSSLLPEGLGTGASLYRGPLSHLAYLLLNGPFHICFFSLPPSPKFTLDYKLHASRDFCLLCSLLYP